MQGRVAAPIVLSDEGRRFLEGQLVQAMALQDLIDP